MMLKQTDIRKARCHLRAADPVMKTVIDAVGPKTAYGRRAKVFPPPLGLSQRSEGLTTTGGPSPMRKGRKVVFLVTNPPLPLGQAQRGREDATFVHDNEGERLVSYRLGYK
ncbi:MAG: hypothetical protein ACLQNE_29310 [Thermoguttaceae bacterium]